MLREPLVVVPDASTPIDITMRRLYGGTKALALFLRVPRIQAGPRHKGLYIAFHYLIAQVGFWRCPRLQMAHSTIQWWRRESIA